MHALFALMFLCPLGTLPIHRDGQGKMRCGSWKALQAYSRKAGPAPSIYLNADAVLAESGGYAITRQAVKIILRAGLGTLSRQAKLSPKMNAGKIVGYQVTGLKGGSIFAKLGLRNGDLVQSVNTLDLSNPVQVLSLYALIHLPGAQVKVGLKRRGQTVKLRWRIVEGPKPVLESKGP